MYQNLTANSSTTTPIIVVKCGGSIINQHTQLASLSADITALQQQGYQIIIVHGGGPDINQLCQNLNVTSHFVDGLRFSSKEIIAITQMALLGTTNVTLVTLLNQAKIAALGLSGHDLTLLQATIIDLARLGYVGEVKQVNSALLRLLLQQQIVPVIAPLAIDDLGNTLNINADLAAAAIAIAVKAEKLVLLSDIDGYYADYPHNQQLVAKLTLPELQQLLHTKVSAGMIPKLTACAQVLEHNIAAHIVNGNHANCLLQAILQPNRIGTRLINVPATEQGKAAIC